MVASASYTMFNHPTQENLRRLLPELSPGLWVLDRTQQGCQVFGLFWENLSLCGFFGGVGDEALLFIVARTKAGTTPCG